MEALAMHNNRKKIRKIQILAVETKIKSYEEIKEKKLLLIELLNIAVEYLSIYCRVSYLSIYSKIIYFVIKQLFLEIHRW